MSSFDEVKTMLCYSSPNSFSSAERHGWGSWNPTARRDIQMTQYLPSRSVY